MRKSATFSPCRKYRYALWRLWDEAKPYVLFIGLNPSTADEVKDDPTVRRCIRYARDWGYGGLCMSNIFAFRATDPKVMKREADPVGLENDEWLKDLARDAGISVAAWGTHGSHMGRGARVIEMIDDLHYLDKTKAGHPKHPLYLPASLRPKKRG